MGEVGREAVEQVGAGLRVLRQDAGDGGGAVGGVALEVGVAVGVGEGELRRDGVAGDLAGVEVDRVAGRKQSQRCRGRCSRSHAVETSGSQNAPSTWPSTQLRWSTSASRKHGGPANGTASSGSVCRTRRCAARSLEIRLAMDTFAISAAGYS